ncbi:MAG TPA: hypothetical protein VFY72_04085 [Beijerinckiaceae bacterium]|nr:hypothetical protein [Beijerinckiaceae bacterium]
MKLKYAISAIAACAIMGGTAVADSGKHKKGHGNSGSVAAGSAVAGPNGSRAAGGALSASTERRGSRCVASSAATTSNNATYTDRRRASASSSTSGTATGSGAVSSSSDGGVFAATDRVGSEADAYGTSTATARNSRRC